VSALCLAADFWILLNCSCLTFLCPKFVSSKQSHICGGSDPCLQSHSVLIITLKVNAVLELWLICLLVLTTFCFYLHSLKVRELGTWQGTTLLQPNKDLFPTSATPPFPFPSIQLTSSYLTSGKSSCTYTCK